jgi:hypothetical protein
VDGELLDGELLVAGFQGVGKMQGAFVFRFAVIFDVLYTKVRLRRTRERLGASCEYQSASGEYQFPYMYCTGNKS